MTYDSGYTGLERVDINVQVPDRYNEGYDDGFESGHTSGVTDGVAQQKALLSSTTITQNGTYTRADGYSAVTVDVPETILERLNEGFMTNGERVYEAEEGKAWNRVKISVDVPDRYDDGVNDQKRKLISTAITENGLYTREDGYNSVLVNVPLPIHQSIETTVRGNGEYTFTPDGEGAVLDFVTVNVDVSPNIRNQNKDVTISDKTPVTVTFDSGYTGLGYVQVSPSGLYDQTDLNNAYNSGYTSGETDGIEEQKALLSSTTITENGTYTSENGWSGVTVNVPIPTAYESIEATVQRNGEYTYTPRSEGAALASVTVNVDVPQTGYTQQDLDNAYNSGYTSGNTDGFASGHTSGVTDGVAQQKALLSSTTITQNGTYTRENGWSAVTVNVSGYTQEDLDAAYNRGWNDGYQSGYTDGQAAKYINTPASVELNLSGDTKPVIVASNTDWTATSPDSWITVSPTSGSGNSNIDIIVESGTTNRTGSVVITSSDSSITKTIVVEQTNPADYVSMPLTFEIISGGTIGLVASNRSQISKTVLYRINNGEWTTITSDSTLNSTDSFNVSSGDIVQFKGDNSAYASSTSYYNSFSGTARYNAYGNIMSLVNSTDFSGLTTVNQYAFTALFKNSRVVNTTNLVLPATTLGRSSYESMFQNCTALTTAPQLPATTLVYYCYKEMFQGCTSLTTAPQLPATTLVVNCYEGMFQSCTNLTTAPELPATTLANYCYKQIFDGCISLNYIKCLATDISAQACTENWVNSVSGTGTFVKAATMENWTTGNDGIPTYWTVQDAS